MNCCLVPQGGERDGDNALRTEPGKGRSLAQGVIQGMPLRRIARGKHGPRGAAGTP
jgi:hypothetical protein